MALIITLSGGFHTVQKFDVSVWCKRVVLILRATALVTASCGPASGMNSKKPFRSRGLQLLNAIKSRGRFSFSEARQKGAQANAAALDGQKRAEYGLSSAGVRCASYHACVSATAGKHGCLHSYLFMMQTCNQPLLAKLTLINTPLFRHNQG